MTEETRTSAEIGAELLDVIYKHGLWSIENEDLMAIKDMPEFLAGPMLKKYAQARGAQNFANLLVEGLVLAQRIPVLQDEYCAARFMENKASLEEAAREEYPVNEFGGRIIPAEVNFAAKSDVTEVVIDEPLTGVDIEDPNPWFDATSEPTAEEYEAERDHQAHLDEQAELDIPTTAGEVLDAENSPADDAWQAKGSVEF